MNNKYDYKFWNQGNKDIYSIISGDLRYVFDELKECLKSLNIKLSHDDIMRAYDMFLRFNGFMPDISSRDDPSNIHGINCISFCPTIPDPKEFIDNGVLNSNVYITGINIANDILPEKFKFEDLDTVTKNINELFHQFSILTNDIIRKINKLHSIIIESGEFYDCNAMYSCNMDRSECAIFFHIYRNPELYEDYIISIQSNILGPIEEEPYISIESFPVNDRDIIKTKINKSTNNLD